VQEDNHLALLWLKIQSLLHRPSTLPLNTIIFGSMLSCKQTQMGLFKLNIAPQITNDQVADIFTKPVWDDIFFKLRKLLLGW
jgi:hypothetical protein